MTTILAAPECQTYSPAMLWGRLCFTLLTQRAAHSLMPQLCSEHSRNAPIMGIQAKYKTSPAQSHLPQRVNAAAIAEVNPVLRGGRRLGSSVPAQPSSHLRSSSEEKQCNKLC